MLNSKETPFISMIFKISRKTFTTLFSELDKVNLHPGQPPILMLLLKETSLTQIEIAKKVCVKPSTMAVVLHKMEKNGLIEKKIDKNDRRVFYISLTEKGKEIAEKTKLIMKELEDRLTDSLTSEEKENLLNCLNKVVLNLEQISENKDKKKN